MDGAKDESRGALANFLGFADATAIVLVPEFPLSIVVTLHPLRKVVALTLAVVVVISLEQKYCVVSVCIFGYSFSSTTNIVGQNYF